MVDRSARPWGLVRVQFLTAHYSPNGGGLINKGVVMRVRTTRRITAGAVVMYVVDVYEVASLEMCNMATASADVFSSVVSLEDIYEQVTNGEWIKGHLEATQFDADGVGIYADLDGEQLDEVVRVEVFG